MQPRFQIPHTQPLTHTHKHKQTRNTQPRTTTKSHTHTHTTHTHTHRHTHTQTHPHTYTPRQRHKAPSKTHPVQTRIMVTQLQFGESPHSHEARHNGTGTPTLPMQPKHTTQNCHERNNRISTSSAQSKSHKLPIDNMAIVKLQQLHETISAACVAHKHFVHTSTMTGHRITHRQTNCYSKTTRLASAQCVL